MYFVRYNHPLFFQTLWNLQKNCWLTFCRYAWLFKILKCCHGNQIKCENSHIELAGKRWTHFLLKKVYNRNNQKINCTYMGSSWNWLTKHGHANENMNFEINVVSQPHFAKYDRKFQCVDMHDSFSLFSKWLPLPF